VPSILVVEDHENLSLALRECIAQEGYQVDVAKDLREAGAKILAKPDLMILDWMLPDGQGIDF